ncbi:MAG TPA: FkbM family methyltransferase [Solirubrobacteraceae bacterium]|nr:FkbM family methyltransferase [Solirubrobacteraceae bacterium]
MSRQLVRAQVPTLAKLRPAKVHSALARRWFEWRMARAPVSGRGEPLSLGSAYGGWMVPTALIAPDWICYCVGAGNDVSFDLELIARFGVRVQSVEPVEQYVDELRQANAGEPRFAIHRAALAAHDGPIRMQRTHNPAGLALSSANLFETKQFVEVPGRTLASLADELGDPRVDLLKFDVEGAEYELVPGLPLEELQVKALSFQVHHNRPPREALRLIALLEERGFELIGMRPMIKLAFARRELLDAIGSEAGATGSGAGNTVPDRCPEPESRPA